MIVRFLAFLLFKIYCRLEIYGRTNIPRQGGFILAGNHASFLDPPLLGAACPRIVSFVAKEALFQYPLFGRFITALNAFPIKTHSADIGSLRLAMSKLQQGKALVLFPEGGRSPDGQLTAPLAGVGLLAAKTNVPIIPAFIQGSDRAMSVHSNLIKPKKIRVYFGPAIWPDKIGDPAMDNKDRYQLIANTTMAAIGSLKQQAK